MNVGIEALFTGALGLQASWVVEDVKLDTIKRRIDFEVGCRGAKFACPKCDAGGRRCMTVCAVRGDTWTSSSSRLGCMLTSLA
jgi:hypothetical protein